MDKLMTTAKLVKAILKTDVKARNSDSYLYLKVIQHEALQRGIDLQGVSIETFLLKMKAWNFSAFETVRRTRQKVQREFPELSGNEDTLQARKAREKACRGFSQTKRL